MEPILKKGYVQSGCYTLYYEIHGDGLPVILLNGGPGFSHEVLEPLQALADTYKLVFFDQRGTGDSDKADTRSYTIDANVEDVEQIRRQLNLGRCAVFGHSWGGMLAQAYALKYPLHISKLILADTFSSIDDLNETFARMRAGLPPELQAVCEKCEGEGLYKDGDTYPPEYQAVLDVAYEPVQISVTPPPSIQDMFSKVAYDVYRVMWGEESEFKITGTLAEFNAEPRLGEIQTPTLVIVGASDMPTLAMAEKTARLIPNARMEVFEHSRHYPFLEEPEKFMRVMRQFLGQGYNRLH
jgi:proline iminopeptidase